MEKAIIKNAADAKAFIEKDYRKNLISLIKICEYQDKLIKALQRILVETNRNNKRK